MRRSRFIILALVIGSMAGSTVVAAAHGDDDHEAAAATYATGTLTWPPAEIVRPDVTDLPDGNDERGLQLLDLPVEFTDPRLSGLLTVFGNGATREFADGRAWIESRTHRIVNDDGAWAGSGQLVRAFSDELGDLFDQESMFLVGEGAYEDLIAYVFVDGFDADAPLKALILEADQPPLPEPVGAE